MDISTPTRTAMRTAAMAALAAQIDVAGAGATLVIYDTTRPAANGAPGGPPMVEVILDYPCGSAAAGALTLADTEFAQITDGGTAVWARLLAADDTWIADLSVGTQAMHDTDPLTAEVIIAATTIYTGAFLALAGAQIVGN
jgi:hypothetical protein